MLCALNATNGYLPFLIVVFWLKLARVKTVHEFIQPFRLPNMASAKQRTAGIALVLVACSLVALQLAYAEDSIGRGPDSDADGLSDSFESRLGSDPNRPDSDSDGLADGFEFTGGDSGVPTNPADRDSDNDGLSDSFEQTSGTDPTERDSDSDGLSDSLELSQSTNPLSGDTDADGVTDNIESWHGSDPLNPESFFVLPESPIGPVLMIIASLGALVGYMHLRKGRTSIAHS